MQNDPNQPVQPNQPFPSNEYNQYNQPGQPLPPNQYGQSGQPLPPTQYGQPGQPSQFNQPYPYNQQAPYAPGMQPPYGQPPVPPKKKSKLGLIIGIVVAALVLCGIIGTVAANMKPATTASTSTPTTQANTSTTPQSTTPSNTDQSSNPGNHKVGETVKVNDNWTAQLLDVKTVPGNDIFKPKSGNIFVAVHISLKNTSSQTQTMSSLLFFKLQDKNGQAYNETIYPDAGTTPDGKVAANSPLAGTIVYEVPSAQHNFTLQFTPDLVSDDMASWDFSV